MHPRTHKKAAVRPDLRVAAGAYPPTNQRFPNLKNLKRSMFPNIKKEVRKEGMKRRRKEKKKEEVERVGRIKDGDEGRMGDEDGSWC